MKITRETLKNGKHRYEVDGKVHTQASNTVYTHASVYAHRVLSEWDVKCGHRVGDTIVFLHSREDLALKGNPTGNGLVAQGAWTRIGMVTISEA